MNDNEYLEFEDRAYIVPTVSRDEQMDFINTYRNVLNDNVQRINTQTHNLGTDVPSNLGGLTGADASFETRYVTPQANTAVAALRAQAQETALTQGLKNLQEQMNKRYKDAYRNAKIREYNTPDTTTPDTENPLNINTEGTGDEDDTGVVKQEEKNGNLTMTGDGQGYYMWDDQKYNVRDMTDREYLALIQAVSPIDTNMGKYKNGDTVTSNGITFRYIDNDQYSKRWVVQTD